MNPAALPLMTALVAGFAHALEADHVAAVTAFVSRRPHPMRALRFGIRWGVGHSLALLLLGGAVILLDLKLAPLLVEWLELGVGVMLVALGLAVIASLRHRTAFDDAHQNAHSAANPHSHVRADLSGWVGAFARPGRNRRLPRAPPRRAHRLALAGWRLPPLLRGGDDRRDGPLCARRGSHLPQRPRPRSRAGRLVRAAAGTMSILIGGFWIARSFL